jgi:hypothetical protein
MLPSSPTPYPKAIIATAEGMVKPKPGGESPRQTGPQRAEGDADLAARRAGEELTKRDDIDVSRFIQPLAASSSHLRRSTNSPRK